MTRRRRASVVALLCAFAAGGCAEPATVTTDEPVEQAPMASTPVEVTPSAETERAQAGRVVITSSSTHVVASITDGDTLRLRGGARVRLVQIDTPETRSGAECGGLAATRALTQLAPPGAHVRLAPEPASERTDRYGRLLRYVYVDQRNVNVAMVARGHAAPYFYQGERGRFATELERAVQRARAQRRGMWGSCPNAVLDAYRGVATGSATPIRLTGGAGDARVGAALLPLQPAGGPDVDCGQLPGPVRVTPGDPHRLDRDGDEVGCDG